MNKKYRYIALSCTVFVIFLILLATYLLTYTPSSSAKEILKDSSIKYSDTNGYLTFQRVEGNPTTGVILYPGGFVSPYSYSVFCAQVVKSGALCVVPKMPANLAIFGVGKAGNIISQKSDITNWYVGGHSLGGPMLSRFLDKYGGEKVKGVFYLASYTDIDLSKKDLKCVTIFGSLDGVLDRDEYQNNKRHLPQGCSELEINGGNHSQFGSYGLQNEDGIATISNEKQIEETVNFILNELTSI